MDASFTNSGTTPVRANTRVVVADRFTVKVSGDAKRIDDLKDAVNEIDLAGLQALKDEGVTED